MPHAIPLLIASLQAACRREPPDTTSPWKPEPVPADSADDTSVPSDTSETGHTGSTDTGTPCPPTGSQRRLSGDLDLALDAWATIEGTAGGFFGYAVAGTGDLTGDGLADLAALTLDERYGTDVGGVYLFPSPLPSGTSSARPAGVRFVDDSPGTGSDYWTGPVFGTMLPLSDLNGDGLPELALATPYQERPAGADDIGQGTVYIVGSPVPAVPGTSHPVDPSYARIGASASALFGYAMAVGDIDGDAVEDLLVSSTETPDPDGAFRGQVFVFAGPLAPGESDERAATYRIYGDNPSPLSGGGPIGMGNQIVAGDLTGDGVAEVVVTSPTSYVGGVEFVGDAYVFEGPLTGDLATSDATGTLHGQVEGDSLGVLANGLGDTDGDGYGEFGMSSTGGDSLIGNAWLFDGPIVGEAVVSARADTHFHGRANGDEAAFVRSAGDLDQDGLDDVAIAAIAVNGDTRGRCSCTTGRSRGGRSRSTRPLTRRYGGPRKAGGQSLRRRWATWTGTACPTWQSVHGTAAPRTCCAAERSDRHRWVRSGQDRGRSSGRWADVRTRGNGVRAAEGEIARGVAPAGWSARRWWMTWAEQLEQRALEQGRQEGREQERARLLDKLRHQLETILILRFGPLPESARQALARADEAALDRSTAALPDVDTLEALFR